MSISRVPHSAVAVTQNIAAARLAQLRANREASTATPSLPADALAPAPQDATTDQTTDSVDASEPETAVTPRLIAPSPFEPITPARHAYGAFQTALDAPAKGSLLSVHS